MSLCNAFVVRASDKPCKPNGCLHAGEINGKSKRFNKCHTVTHHKEIHSNKYANDGQKSYI